MALPYARSIAEEHLYMELHPCECGESAKTGITHGLLQTEQGIASDHQFVCAGCGTRRRFVFRLPGLAPQHADRYGGPEPSRIIDAGEWRMIALSYMSEAEEVRADPVRRKAMLEECLAAYQEMLKFVPPGADRVPDSAFFTEYGREIRDEEASVVFNRSFLEAMVDGVRRELAELP
ncbi:hypothetical protein ACIGEZ_28425 [Streptomyces sp. NPDC085481]|uniref:hypothetical protein n=1 Tax=Streptomyces sp. NPDC085481 TaxID=3365727 RepID=UPI0037D51496